VTATAPFRVEVLDLAAGRDEIVYREMVTGHRYARVPKRCDDCNGEVSTITPAAGYTAALLRVHQRTCPQFGSLARGAAR
jgi:hypothetical protein